MTTEDQDKLLRGFTVNRQWRQMEKLAPISCNDQRYGANAVAIAAYCQVSQGRNGAAPESIGRSLAKMPDCWLTHIPAYGNPAKRDRMEDGQP